jgi:hypothetical protein
LPLITHWPFSFRAKSAQGIRVLLVVFARLSGAAAWLDHALSDRGTCARPYDPINVHGEILNNRLRRPSQSVQFHLSNAKAVARSASTRRVRMGSARPGILPAPGFSRCCKRLPANEPSVTRKSDDGETATLRPARTWRHPSVDLLFEITAFFVLFGSHPRANLRGLSRKLSEKFTSECRHHGRLPQTADFAAMPKSAASSQFADRAV